MSCWAGKISVFSSLKRKIGLTNNCWHLTVKMFFFTSMPCLYEPSTEAAVDANPTAATVSMILPLTSFPEIMSLKSVLGNHRSSHRASWVSGEIMINLLKWSSMDRIYLSCSDSVCFLSVPCLNPSDLKWDVRVLFPLICTRYKATNFLLYKRLPD